MSIGGKTLVREPTCVARSCDINQPVDELALVFVKGDELVEHEPVKAGLRIAVASEPSSC